MGRDKNWPNRCTLMGCEKPTVKPHHHHLWKGHLQTIICQCDRVDQPGTNPRRVNIVNTDESGRVLNSNEVLRRMFAKQRK